MNSATYAARPPRVIPPSAPREVLPAGKAAAWALLAVVVGAGWGLLSIAALRAEKLGLLNITDSWWAWGTFLVLLSLLPGGACAKLCYVLLGGSVSVTVYYVLKAWWAVGYPSHARGFSAYFQTENYGYYLGIVALAAPVLAVGVSLIGRAFTSLTER